MLQLLQLLREGVQNSQRDHSDFAMYIARIKLLRNTYIGHDKVCTTRGRKRAVVIGVFRIGTCFGFKQDILGALG